MSILAFFLLILIIIKIFKIETKLSLLLALLITYMIYTNKTIFTKMNNMSDTVQQKMGIDEVPNIIMKDWYYYLKNYLKDIANYNKENYIDVMRSLKHFQELYLEIINGANIAHQRLDNLTLLQKEILNLLHSTVYTLPVTQNETLENNMLKKLEFVKTELDFRLEEIRNFVNKDWDNGNINYLSKPVYPGTLTSIPSDHSPNYSFY
jgi:hypothetical protein